MLPADEQLAQPNGKSQAMAKDHVPVLRTSILMMDMRIHGKDFDFTIDAPRENQGSVSSVAGYTV